MQYRSATIVHFQLYLSEMLLGVYGGMLQFDKYAKRMREGMRQRFDEEVLETLRTKNCRRPSVKSSE